MLVALLAAVASTALTAPVSVQQGGIVGLRIDGTPELIDKAAAAGIKNLVLELPADGTGWNAAIARANENGQSYYIAVDSAPPATDVYVIEPAGNRRPGQIDEIEHSLKVAGSSSALAVLASERNGDPIWHKVFEAEDETISIKAVNKGPSAVLLVYPRVTTLMTPDFWEGFDTRRDELIGALKNNELGDGYLGVINPLGPAFRFPGDDESLIPASPLFRYELETILVERYRTASLGLKAWAVGSNDIKSLQHLSRLVPLWREKRGVSKLWDPATDRLYSVDGLRSAAWRDIHDAVKATMTRRMDRLAQSIREMAGGSVAQEWVGWNGPYQAEESHFNIIGASVTVRSLLDAVDGVSRPLSSSLATVTKPRVVATNLTFDPEADRLPSPAQVAGELMTMGVSECYFSSSTEEGIAAVGAAAKASSGNPISDPMKPLYFPLAAWYPCAPGRVAPGVFWLPRKEQGQTLNFGAGLMGYRYIGLSENFIAVWSTVGEQRVKMKMSDPKTLEVRALGIQNPNIRLRRDDFDITVTATPILFMSPQDVPAPVQSWEETTAKVDTLLNGYAGLVQPFGSEQLDFITAVKNWKISPGSSLITMMTMLEEMAVKAAPFMWVEAEKVRKNTFSGVVERAGASGGRTLALTTLLSPPEGGYQLEFQFTPRVPGPSEIWVSGRIPSGSRNNIVVTCAAQSLRSSDQPRSPYGDELAWYKLGDVELPEGEHLLTLNCDAENGARIELDTIVIAPKGWAPTGGIVPKDWLKPTKEPLSTD